MCKTIEYKLLTNPNKVVQIPEEAKEIADKLLDSANPQNGDGIDVNNVYVHIPLVLAALVCYRRRELQYNPAQDIVILNIAEQIANKEKKELVGEITEAQDLVRKKYFR